MLPFFQNVKWYSKHLCHSHCFPMVLQDWYQLLIALLVSNQVVIKLKLRWVKLKCLEALQHLSSLKGGQKDCFLCCRPGIIWLPKLQMTVIIHVVFE